MIDSFALVMQITRQISTSRPRNERVSLAYSEALTTAGMSASVDTVDGTYDHALAETVNGLYKAELSTPSGSGESVEVMKLTTMGK